jgi:hypothetical protein
MNSDPVWVQGGSGWVGGYRNPTRWLGHKASGLGPLLGSTEKGGGESARPVVGCRPTRFKNKETAFQLQLFL